MLPKLAEIFGISVDTLLGVVPPEAEIHVAEVVTADEEAAENDGIHIQNGAWEFRLDTGRTSLLATAMLFIWVGIVYMLRGMAGQDTNLWSLLWPSALLIYGGFALYQKFSFLRLACTFMGACFLFSNMNDMKLGGTFVLPALLILLGASLLVKALRKSSTPHFSVTHNGKIMNHKVTGCKLGEDSFDCSVSFCEDRQPVSLPLLRSGSIDVSFGDLTVDLTGCEEFAPDCKIDANCSFGNLTILVPGRVRAELDYDSAFGSVEVRGECSSEAAGSVHIDADASFGHITIKYL